VHSSSPLATVGYCCDRASSNIRTKNVNPLQSMICVDALVTACHPTLLPEHEKTGCGRNHFHEESATLIV
jgi:hypothetical protein